MRFIFHILLYITILFMVMQNHLVVAALLAMLFSYRCGAVWLIPLAIAIDAYFGAFAAIPVISIVTCCWYVLSEFVRPRLLMQYERHEKAS